MTLDMNRALVSRRNFMVGAALAVPSLALGAAGSAPGVGGAQGALRRLASHVKVVRRGAWGGPPERASLLRAATGYTMITVHHSGATTNFHRDEASVIHDLNGVLTSHIERRYADIGYHLVVDYAGRVWEGRSLDCEGAHVSGHNPKNIGVMLLGNFEQQQASPEQLTALDRVVTDLRQYYGVRRESVYGHRDLGASACPGEYLYPFVRRMRT